jgi:hypothetical protein
MKKPLFLVLVLCMVCAMAASAQAAQSQEVSDGTYDIVVYTDGTEIIAEDNNGQVISSGIAGADDSEVIQAAMNAVSEGTVVLQAGTYALSSSIAVRASNPTPTPTPTATPTPIPSGQSDLVVTDISWEPATPATGDMVTLKATIKNQGDSPTPAGVKHGVLFTFDDGGAGSGVWSDDHTASIAPGAWVTVTANGGSAGATWKAVEGTHTVKANVDDVYRIAEGDETNNVFSKEITVRNVAPAPTPTATPTSTPTPSGSPDLVVTDISWEPASPATGDTIVMKAVIKNQGTAATPSGTTHGVAFTSDGNLGSKVWSDDFKTSIAPGASVTVTANGGSAGATWTAVAGTYTVQAWVDDVNRMVEENEDNNVLTKTMTVKATTTAPTPTVTPTPTATATPRPTQTPTPTPTPGNNVYGADANPTGNPIGGGNGYTKMVSRSDADFIVDTKSELVSALQSARSGDVIYIEGNANIDMSGTYNVRIPAGVTLASNRGENGASGGRVYQSKQSSPPSSAVLFRVDGEHVRITGVRIEGPEKGTNSVSYKPIGIYCSYRNLEVDNCEIFGWCDDGICLTGTGGSDMKTGGYIHHNYIHHCQMDGLGYGISISGGSEALIEANYFDYVRHAITGTGVAGDGYEARYNICGPNALATSPHPFDMHGKVSGSTTIAGDEIRIHHNTFLATNPSGVYPIAIRGVPRVGAYIDHNWFYYTQQAPVWQTDGRSGITMTDNLIGAAGTLSKSGPIKYV